MSYKFLPILLWFKKTNLVVWDNSPKQKLYLKYYYNKQE